MPQVDHRIGQGFKGVVQLAEALEPKQQAPELVFPGEHPLDCVEPLFKNVGIEERLASALGLLSAARVGVDIGVMPRLKIALRLRRQS
ncbi:hypothetical protein ACFQAT_27850 [Undibacterium arcticum]|uniref:hypothetical protein n=1 Tax=Undibacterium arcticum TaxID=1762892 RepID=UPI003605CEEE